MKSKKILIISNGHGEDSIAVTLIKEIKKSKIACDILPMALVGNGSAYKEVDLQPLLINKPMPSGGFIRSFSALCKDIFAGLIGQILKQKQCIKKHGKDVDICIAVGDIFCLWMGSSLKTTVYFLPTAKSDTFMPHSAFECWFMKKKTQVVFARDEKTATSLKKSGCNAQYLGNPMMDNLFSDRTVTTLNKNECLITICPGSREEAYKNCAFCVELIDAITQDHPHIKACIAKSKQLNFDTLEEVTNSKIRNEKTHSLLIRKNKNDIIVSDDFLACINQANLVIGLAGTANEQALYIGKTVIAFEGFGPQSSLKRFQEQQVLMGRKLIIVPNRQINSIKRIVLNHLTNINKHKAIPEKSAAIKIIDTIFQN